MSVTKGGLVVALLAMLLTGCSGGTSQEASPASGGSDLDSGAAAVADSPAEGAAGAVEGAALVLPGVTAEIRTASLTVRVEDVRVAAERAETLTVQQGGAVSSAQTQLQPAASEDGASAHLVLRVPNPDLPELLRGLAALGTPLDLEESSEDVSAEVADVDSRVASARASLAQLRALMERATSVEDVLRVEAEVARRQADLEALLARQRVLADRTALATVDVSFVTSADAGTGLDDDLGFLTGLRDGWDAFVSAAMVGLTVLGALLPFVVALAVVGVPALLLWRLRRDGERTREAAAPPTP